MFEDKSGLWTVPWDISQEVRDCWVRWKTFMDNEVDFWRPDSDIHTKKHCARVLLYALMLAEQKSVRPEEADTLAVAACFHDSRRLNDGADKGHGQRAADHYKDYCEANRVPYEEQAYCIMAYHDQSDEAALPVLRERFPGRPGPLLLYAIFKDADALDRYRLGIYDLDVTRLRTEEAVKMTDFAKHLVLWDWPTL